MSASDPTPPRPIYVVGSSNYDLTIATQRLPAPSETLLGGDYVAGPGGKGANQAVGLLRLGSDVRFLSRVGQDHYGRTIREHLQNLGLDTSHVHVDPHAPTGLALITLDPAGTRTIVVAPGANSALGETDVEDWLKGAPDGATLVTQLEIPPATVGHALRLAKTHNLRTVLHASPAVQFPHTLLRLVDLLVLNQTELHVLSGASAQHMETARSAASQLVAEGARTVLVSMGTRGVLIVGRAAGWPHGSNDLEVAFVPGFKVRVKDGNVASSAFIAGLVHCMHRTRESDDLKTAVRYGLAAMAVSLARPGGQASLATESDVEAVVRSGSTVLSDRATAQADRLQRLSQRASNIRRRIIRMLYAARSGHPGGSLSVVEVLTALYFHAMVYNPRDPGWSQRDRLVLSKGHAAPALYAALIEAGFLDPSLETDLRKLGSPLQGHPDMKRCPGVDMSTGSLGQGLSVACGMALGARHARTDYRVYCILGDGEVQEGQVWEAAMTAAHFGLANLCAIVDYNALQIDGSISQVKSPIEPLVDKWKAFGWHVLSCDGHDLGELCDVFDAARRLTGRPTMVIAHTVKGHGVSFMEGVIEYHGSALSESEVQRALAELEDP